MNTRRFVVGVLLALLAGQTAGQGGYPARPVKIIVTLAPGASADTIETLKWAKVARASGVRADD